MHAPISSEAQSPFEPWYKFGVAFLSLEMVIAIAVSGYSLFMTFHGIGGFPGKH
jgi:hypothetical protein